MIQDLRMGNDMELTGGLRRRAFLHSGVLILTASNLGIPSVCAEDQESDLKVGLVTDLHYADKPPVGTRHYRETPDKLAEAAERFGNHKLAFVVELGDLVDAADSVDTELGYLKRINRDFSAICEDRHYVLGNHCVQTLTKEEFLDTVGQERSHYSFDAGDFHFVVLDSCFRGDGEPYGARISSGPIPTSPSLNWIGLEPTCSKQRRGPLCLLINDLTSATDMA